jgi:hypothetical protein
MDQQALNIAIKRFPFMLKRCRETRNNSAAVECIDQIIYEYHLVVAEQQRMKKHAARRTDQSI